MFLSFSNMHPFFYMPKLLLNVNNSSKNININLSLNNNCFFRVMESENYLLLYAVIFLNYS